MLLVEKIVSTQKNNRRFGGYFLQSIQTILAIACCELISYQLMFLFSQS